MNRSPAPEHARELVRLLRGSAEFIDPRTRVHERAAFEPEDGERRWLCTDSPVDATRATVVICSSIATDLLANYRREVLLARALAQRGIATIRFHYRGTGNSYGDPAETSFETLCEDARLAVDHARSAFADAPVGLLGTRVGALVAAAVVAEIGDAPLALWEPVLSGADYMRQAMRARRIHNMKEQDGSGIAASAEAELDAKGWIGFLGFRVDRPLHDSLVVTDLRSVLGAVPRRVLLTQFSPSTELGASLSALMSDLSSRGFPVRAATHPISESWWFQNEATVPGETIDSTVAWFASTLLGDERG